MSGLAEFAFYSEKMAGSELFDSVPIVDVHCDNLVQIWPHMLDAIKTASFISLDTEMSGLGERKKLMAQSVDDRYKSMCKAAQSRAILSVGVSCFALRLSHSQSQPRNLHFTVKTYNILVLCGENFVVEPGSLKFLTEHGFDFNKQYSKGIPYVRGCEDPKNPVNFLEPSVRNLFLQIALSFKPVILHNGLLDLAFLYENFYNQLPGNLMTFVSDLSEIFTGGIYDTKYVAEFHAREPASYLAYLFRKSQRMNSKAREGDKSHVTLGFEMEPSHSSWTEHVSCSSAREGHNMGETSPCELYAAHGFCHQGKNCKQSHDIDVILDQEDKTREAKKRRNRKRRRPQESEEAEGPNIELEESPSDLCPKVPSENERQQNSSISSNSKTRASDGHRAGFDAFMTGFCMACYVLRFESKPASSDAGGDVIESDVMAGMQNLENRVSLSGKEVPLHITRSHFSKSSATHRAKLERVKSALEQDAESMNNGL